MMHEVKSTSKHHLLQLMCTAVVCRVEFNGEDDG